MLIQYKLADTYSQLCCIKLVALRETICSRKIVERLQICSDLEEKHARNKDTHCSPYIFTSLQSTGVLSLTGVLIGGSEEPTRNQVLTHNLKIAALEHTRGKLGFSCLLLLIFSLKIFNKLPEFPGTHSLGKS